MSVDDKLKMMLPDGDTYDALKERYFCFVKNTNKLYRGEELIALDVSPNLDVVGESDD